MDKHKEEYIDAITEIAENLRANNPDFQHTATKFGELIDSVNKALKIENGIFAVFLYMISKHWQGSVDDIKVEDIVEFYNKVQKLKKYAAQE